MDESLRPQVCVAAVIECQNRVLLLRKRDFPGKSKGWVFPGGRVEYLETLRQAVRREVEEETGLNLFESDFDPVPGLVTESLPNEPNDLHLIGILFRVSITPWMATSAYNREPDNHESMLWFLWDELPEPLFHGTATTARYRKNNPSVWRKENEGGMRGMREGV